MKLIWRLYHEIKSTRFSTLLIVVELIFSVVCYQLCFTLTSDYLDKRSFFRKNYYNNSFKVYFEDIDDKQVEDIAGSIGSEEWFCARHYYSDDDEGIFITSYSDHAFELAGIDPELKAKLDDDSGLARPCLVSEMLAETYPVGKKCMIGGSSYYVCGLLEGEDLYYMSTSVDGPGCIVVSQNSGEPEARYIDGCLFTKVSKDAFSAAKETLDTCRDIDGYEVFDYRKALKNEFAAVSGMLLVGVWIAVISTIGQLANNYLTFKKNEKDHMMMICIGAKRRDITSLYVLRLLVCVAVSLPAAIIASKLFSMSQGLELLSAKSILFAFGIAMVIEFISVLIIEINFSSKRCLYAV
ncbi:MAG: hypothetical protein K6C68_11075 [Ruminococcus sp.]|nr:hypothetical protein [Ruminococcus sp.]